jgi:restriction endonuclease S subunit
MSIKTKTIATKEEARPALVPKLRFPEFQNAGEWQVITIGDSKPFVTSGSRGWAPFYAEKGELFVRITNLWRDSIYLDLTDSKFVQLPPGANEGVRTQLKVHDVLISITADIGIIGFVDESVPSPAYINQHIALVRFDEEQLCGQYVAYFLASEKSQKLFRASTDTGTKAGMSLIGIQKIKLMFPGLPEQQKIAECLSSVDELIAVQARKVDALKTHKKGLMQQLFPREGETQPRLRFPEFQNAGEWEVKPLGKLVELQSGFAFSSSNFGSEGTKLVTPKNFTKYGHGNFDETMSKYTTEEVPERFICSPGDLLVLLTDLTPTCELLGKPLLLEDKDGTVLLNQRVARVEPCASKLEALFLKYVFLSESYSNRIVKTATGSTVKHSSNKVLQEIPLFHPSLPEQQRIAKCLSSLDSLITAETQKLETLKTHKKGLMQQLFPAPEESLP